jgi:SAM-dependent methyltransferase
MYKYKAGFFDYINAGSLESAGALIPILCEHLEIASVLDLGCGQGAWLKVWDENGAGDITGIDGPYVDPGALLIDPARFQAGDLTRPIRLEREFDLVQCLEVAEHIPPEASATLVENLVRHGSLLLFSAATPGQGGEHHINEQSPDFWRDLFKSHGYVLLDFLRPRLAGLPEVESWYRYNTFLFVARDQLASLPALVRDSALEDQLRVPRVEPLSYRIRCELLRLLPRRTVDAVAHLKHLAIARSRSSVGRRAGGQANE